MIINPYINQLYVAVDGHVFGRTNNMLLCIYILIFPYTCMHFVGTATTVYNRSFFYVS